MNYLTPEQVLFIHARLLKEIGGERGIRDLGLLPSAVARPKATFDNQDLYPDLFSKTAALFESLVGNHPFVEGNKRTAITSAGLFLNANRARLIASQEELESFTLLAAQGRFSFEELVAWFKRFSVLIENK